MEKFLHPSSWKYQKKQSIICHPQESAAMRRGGPIEIWQVALLFREDGTAEKVFR